ncbi:MAG: Pseudouridine synthase, RluA family [Parcubacteria group bacterium GW2011_GWA2_42_35]|nr:MAG: Pseudouridine synthase, RluA family [Parcubacteria group bacterium GW2011_GWA2_42_35]
MGELNIIYQDDDVLAVNKPAGLDVNFIAEKYPQMILAHRLDKDTSGVLLMAKNPAAYDYLKSQFQKRIIKKTYLALVEGIIKEKEGLPAGRQGRIDLSIGRSKKDFRRRISVGKKQGKVRQALTLYKVKKRYKEYTLVEVEPQTGRTHQIRSHFKAINHPIVCDKLYGTARSVGKECPFGLKRQFLHALSLEFTHPNGSRLKLEADLPEDLERVLRDLQQD